VFKVGSDADAGTRAGENSSVEMELRGMKRHM
jgi:hypothetical protein